MNNQNTPLSASNIFIIDDEVIAASVIKLHLLENGYNNLHVFNNSVEAMEILSFVQADLILTDVQMPELGGKFLTRLVRNYPHLKSTPVIVITSDDTPATETHLMGNGVYGIVHKPADPKELMEKVEGALKLRQILLNGSDGNEEALPNPKHTGQIEKENSLRSVFKRS